MNLPWNRQEDRDRVSAAEVESGETQYPSPSADAGSSPGAESPSAPITAEGVMEALKEVYDPELAINIVDLGLVYGVEIEGRSVRVRMTLTSPGCPIGPTLRAMVHGTVLRTYPGVEDVAVELVWSPPWDPYTMASEEARDMLGIW